MFYNLGVILNYWLYYFYVWSIARILHVVHFKVCFIVFSVIVITFIEVKVDLDCRLFDREFIHNLWTILSIMNTLNLYWISRQPIEIKRRVISMAKFWSLLLWMKYKSFIHDPVIIITYHSNVKLNISTF